MANVLDKIVADKRIELTSLEEQLPLETFQSTLVKSEKSFFDALNKTKAGFIFECKKASPSKGLIRENFDLDEIIDAYTDEAACFSVLTDEKYFQGKFEYLDYVTSRVNQPVLNKDFFVSPYQVYRARYHNADAILLMLSVLTDDEYQALHEIADSLALDVLTEVSNEEETYRALALGAKIIGINNRNLRDLSTDLAMTEKLVPIIRSDANFDGVIISESGIYTYQDLLRLNHLVDGYLVGSSLMAQPNVKKAVQQLAYGKVKVCGVTSIEQAKLISSFPVSFLGLIFVPASPRYVAPETALEIVHEFQNTNFVGVFQDQAITQVAELANRLALFAVQLHGNEDQEYIDSLRLLLNDGCEIWKVKGIHIDQTADDLTLDLNNIDKWLFDSKTSTAAGGTGQAFDWRQLSKEVSEHFILAGGITPTNALSAFTTGASIIDVNSGVEDNPGEKSATKLEALFTALRA
ncbi:bifunctional indole-3-glycerol-phosphate synthase TrpC/phosphoribosylanthranilate isomerase TrpF [Glaciecola sp. 1036]|uniref:bifunctional indole-3-glycerol-phosphate synthase TrpC/phosphoribosylanthranilate isomerase TrpF n=1 Tax=Alteromonadaceae TaxID=72275 RepID=UPI003CFFAB75